MRRSVVGSVIGVAAALTVGALMLPLRPHLAIATAALVLVVPVVIGVAAGGWTGGIVSVVAGFFVYDFAFIPPYGTLAVKRAEDWVALGVYAAVMAVVARLVSHLHEAQAAADTRTESARHLLDLSELMLSRSPDLASVVVEAVREAFDVEGVALMQPSGDRLEVVASAGTPITREELERLRAEARLPVPLSTAGSAGGVQALALASSGGPVGILVLRDVPTTRAVREALPVLANHLAIALERSALEERAHRAEILEEVDRLRRALVGAVSHDLRTPLATVKVASTTLLGDARGSLSAAEVDELYRLIDEQTDRLTHLVNNLLDMTRIQAGALEVRRTTFDVARLAFETIGGLRAVLGDRPVEVVAKTPPPLVDADPILAGEVLANLLDNASRHAPTGSAVTVEVSDATDGRVRVAVTDEGDGVPATEREAVFATFVRFDTGGRSGLGLAIAKAFVEAHGDRIWVEDAPGGGARFVFTLPAAHFEGDR